MNKKLTVIFVLILVASIGLFLSYHMKIAGKESVTQTKCPEDYGTNTEIGLSEYNADLEKWMDAYYKANPDVEATNMWDARQEFLIENNCTSSLKKGLVYYPPGLGMYESYLENAETYESRLGYSFQYPDYLFVSEDLEAFIPQRLVILPNSSKGDPDGGINGIMISVSKNDENMTPLEWLDSPASGVNLPSEEYVFTWDLDGQEAIMIEGGAWVVVNTPDNKYRLSIALIKSAGIDSNLSFTEMGILVDSLRFAR